jgi:hypothetical protein
MLDGHEQVILPDIEGMLIPCSEDSEVSVLGSIQNIGSYVTKQMRL